jgi:hypothetical protein
VKSKILACLTCLFAASGIGWAETAPVQPADNDVEQIRSAPRERAKELQPGPLIRGTNETRRATADVLAIHGFVLAITVTDGGAGYQLPPKVTIKDDIGFGAIAVATVSNGVVSAITVENPGKCFISPVVSIAPPTMLTPEPVPLVKNEDKSNERVSNVSVTDTDAAVDSEPSEDVPSSPGIESGTNAPVAPAREGTGSSGTLRSATADVVKTAADSLSTLGTERLREWIVSGPKSKRGNDKQKRPPVSIEPGTIEGTPDRDPRNEIGLTIKVPDFEEEQSTSTVRGPRKPDVRGTNSAPRVNKTVPAKTKRGRDGQASPAAPTEGGSRTNHLNRVTR